MKKFGFTLAEILLSMTIIGIVAALTAPTLINMMPNKEKVMTLKYAKLISEINADLLNNRSLYVEGAFKNTGEPLDPEFWSLLSSSEKQKLKMNKYGYLLKKNLEVADEGPLTAETFAFKTADGYQWNITCRNQVPKVITIDMNGSLEGPNKYGSANVKNPDKFSFLIDEDTGAAECDKDIDPITCRYLECPFYMNNKKLDYKCMNTYSGECACKDN